MKTFYIVVGVTALFLFAALAWSNIDRNAPILVVVIAFGAVGAVIREHVHLSKGTPKASAWLSGSISPIVGGLLAVLLVALLYSGLVSGDLFPGFANAEKGFTSAFDVLRSMTLKTNADFYKLLAWSCVAGYSERYITALLEKLAG